MKQLRVPLEDDTDAALTAEHSGAIEVRAAGRPLEDFVGAAPNLTGGLTPEEFLARVHGEE